MRALLLLCTLALAAGCASAGPAPPVSVGAGVEPWEIPPSELGTQRIYRARYDGPEGDGDFRLTFRLESPDRFQAEGNAVGRKLWTLDVDGDTGLWVDHREEVFCHLRGRLDLAGSLLAPMPFRAFPALLLGRLPETPQGEVETRVASPPAADPQFGDPQFGDPQFGDTVRRISYPGADGRRWRARLEGGRVRSWTLLRDGETMAEWRHRGGEAVLVDRAHGVDLRWRQGVREELAGIPPLVLPPGYRSVECRGLTLRPGVRQEAGSRGGSEGPEGI